MPSPPEYWAYRHMLLHSLCHAGRGTQATEHARQSLCQLSHILNPSAPHKLGMVVHTCNPGTQVLWLLYIHGSSWLYLSPSPHFLSLPQPGDTASSLCFKVGTPPPLQGLEFSLSFKIEPKATSGRKFPFHSLGWLVSSLSTWHQDAGGVRILAWVTVRGAASQGSWVSSVYSFPCCTGFVITV